MSGNEFLGHLQRSLREHSPGVTRSTGRESGIEHVSLQPARRKPKKSVAKKLARRSADNKPDMAAQEQLDQVREEALREARREAAEQCETDQAAARARRKSS